MPSSQKQNMTNTGSTGDSSDIELPTMPDSTAITRMLPVGEALPRVTQASPPQAAPSMACKPIRRRTRRRESCRAISDARMRRASMTSTSLEAMTITHHTLIATVLPSLCSVHTISKATSIPGIAELPRLPSSSRICSTRMRSSWRAGWPSCGTDNSGISVDQSALACRERRFRAADHIQRSQHRLHMAAHRVLGKIEAPPDQLV